MGLGEYERALLPTGLRGRIRQLIADGRTTVEFDLADDATRLGIRWKPSDCAVRHEVAVPLRPWLGTTGGERFTFEFVKPGAQLIMARSLLVRSHPLGTPSRGVLLAARYADPREGCDAYATSNREGRPDPWSDAWRYVPRGGEIVGVVVIDRLLHGDPRGRDRLAEELGEQLPERHAVMARPARAERQLRLALREWAGDTHIDSNGLESFMTQVGLDTEVLDGEPERRRSDVVDTLGVMWLSRIAVDAPYRGRRSGGVGQALVAEARSAVRRLPWDARAVEVIRTIDYDTKEERARADHLVKSAKDRDSSAQDFLTSAGYALTPQPLRSSPIRPLDDTGNCTTNRRTTKKLYYYALTEEPR